MWLVLYLNDVNVTHQCHIVTYANTVLSKDRPLEVRMTEILMCGDLKQASGEVR